MRLAERYKLILCAILGHKEEVRLLVAKKIYKKQPHVHEVVLQHVTDIEITRCKRCWHTRIIEAFTIDKD